MNEAQELWHIHYRAFSFYMRFKAEDDAVEEREKMLDVRREAALERRIEAQQREIKRLQELLDMANYAVWREIL